MKNDESLFGSRTHESIYHQIGGEPVLNAAVDLFYEKVLADKRIKQFFDGTDMPRLRETQKQFSHVRARRPDHVQRQRNA